jgi:hypothetical protein
MTRRGKIAALAGGGVAIAVAVYVMWPGDASSGSAGSRGARPGAVPAGPTAGATAVAPGGAGASRAPALGVAVEPYPEHGTDGISTDDPLAAYRRANVYPPASRPLTAEHVDLLAPNRRHETARPTDADDGVTYLFTADRYFVIGDEPLIATLEAWRDGAPIDVKIVQAFAVVLTAGTPPKLEDAIPIAYAADGGRAVGRFAPATIKGLARQTAIGMYVEFAYGGATQRAHFDFQYTPSAGIPARFTGRFTDAIENGSLMIRAGVDVIEAGAYVIDCNLYDASNNPVAWTRFKGQLATGARDAELMFFGKVIVDAGARGPFHIGELRGARFVPGMDPDLEQMPTFTGTYTTRPYETAAFSSAEWDSPEKQNMIDLLTAEAARGVHRGAAAAGDPGRPADDDH